MIDGLAGLLTIFMCCFAVVLISGGIYYIGDDLFGGIFCLAIGSFFASPFVYFPVRYWLLPWLIDIYEKHRSYRAEKRLK